MSIDTDITAIIHRTLVQHPYPLLFVTLSGSHAYGFSSPDSDLDIRGVHNLPTSLLLGLVGGHETHTVMDDTSMPEVDLQTHDLLKFLKLLLNKNGTMLEILTCPLIVQTTPIHAQLRSLVPQIITRHHAHHYQGFASNEEKRLAKMPRVKSLVYLFRILLTGIHLMESGEVETNLGILGEMFHLPYISALIAIKQSGAEKAILSMVDQTHYDRELERLKKVLQASYEVSTLPEVVGEQTRTTLNYLLLQARGVTP